MSRGMPRWHSGQRAKTQPWLIAFFRSASSNVPQTRHIARLDRLAALYFGVDTAEGGCNATSPTGAANPRADAYRRKVSIPETTILALTTSISIPTSDTETLASITSPLSSTLSIKS